MQSVLVLDKHKKPLMPCRPARARKLLSAGKAVVIRHYPFTLLLLDREGGDTQPVELKIDPGSRNTGVALVVSGTLGRKVVWAAHLQHRGLKIRKLLDTRRAIRRGRRNRKTRYRMPRFSNRCRPAGWLPPSLQSRVGNVVTCTKRLISAVPLSQIHVETVRFDTQKLKTPEISGVEYTQGSLAGYETREYLLEKWNRRCAYCTQRDVPLEIDHIIPRSKGGSNRVSNLTLACHACNQRKGSSLVENFLKNQPNTLQKVLKHAEQSLRDAAAVNASRYAIGEALRVFEYPINFWSGGQTKYNRCTQGYGKEHWIDAACVGPSGNCVYLPPGLKPLNIKATGRGSRQFCRVDRFGFPRTAAKRQKKVQGFQTGDIVEAVVPTGKKIGRHKGRGSSSLHWKFQHSHECWNYPGNCCQTLPMLASL